MEKREGEGYYTTGSSFYLSGLSGALVARNASARSVAVGDVDLVLVLLVCCSTGLSGWSPFHCYVVLLQRAGLCDIRVRSVPVPPDRPAFSPPATTVIYSAQFEVAVRL